jgi:hypothetical protein
MSNMKIVALIATTGRQLEAEILASREQDMATTFAIVEEELEKLEAKINRLRDDVEAMKAKPVSPSR